MITLKPDTCACVIIANDAEPNNRRKMILQHKCRSHNTAQEAMDYNAESQFRSNDGKKNRRTSRDNPNFQR